MLYNQRRRSGHASRSGFPNYSLSHLRRSFHLYARLVWQSASRHSHETHFFLKPIFLPGWELLTVDILYDETRRWETGFGCSTVFNMSDNFNMPQLRTLEQLWDLSDLTKFNAPNLCRLRIHIQLFKPKLRKYTSSLPP
ncbi:hypothetical protein BDR05DRAFT_543305 [Suillus weaverae]|nr:hypothetical protein BDR05DRAFT_543305 [Suillus weaverae]